MIFFMQQLLSANKIEVAAKIMKIKLKNFTCNKPFDILCISLHILIRENAINILFNHTIFRIELQSIFIAKDINNSVMATEF